MKARWFSMAAVVLTLASGCNCCPLMDPYFNAVDDVNDHHVYFDRCYNPRFDITRAKKPDWCSPFNRMFCKRGCTNGCYDRYDDCNLYPPVYPYQLPSNVMPPPVVRTKRIPRPLDTELEYMPDATPDVPAPTPDSPPAPKPL